MCILLFLVEMIFIIKKNNNEYIQLNIPNVFQNIDYKARGASSYLLVSLFKKYFIISILVSLNNKPFICSMIVSVVFGLNGIYILRYRFF